MGTMPAGASRLLEAALVGELTVIDRQNRPVNLNKGEVIQAIYTGNS